MYRSAGHVAAEWRKTMMTTRTSTRPDAPEGHFSLPDLSTSAVQTPLQLTPSNMVLRTYPRPKGWQEREETGMEKCKGWQDRDEAGMVKCERLSGLG